MRLLQCHPWHIALFRLIYCLYFSFLTVCYRHLCFLFYSRCHKNAQRYWQYTRQYDEYYDGQGNPESSGYLSPYLPEQIHRNGEAYAGGHKLQVLLSSRLWRLSDKTAVLKGDCLYVIKITIQFLNVGL